MNQLASKSADKMIALYLERADAAHLAARKCRSPEKRDELLGTAHSWLALAMELERSTDGAAKGTTHPIIQFVQKKTVSSALDSIEKGFARLARQLDAIGEGLPNVAANRAATASVKSRAPAPRRAVQP